MDENKIPGEIIDESSPEPKAPGSIDKPDYSYIELLKSVGAAQTEDSAESSNEPANTDEGANVNETKSAEGEIKPDETDGSANKPADEKSADEPKCSVPPLKKNEEPIDISSNSEKSKNPFKRLAVRFKKLPKKKKVIYSIIAVFLCIVLVLGTALGIFINGKFNLLGDKMDAPGDDVIYEDEDYGVIEGDLGTSDFKSALEAWATTGNENIMSSKNVINVLLIGADSRKGTNTGNTDVMMIVSLNRKTKQIKLVSFLRDSYLFIEGDNSSYCSKLNAAYSMGGANTLMTTIEHNYKIDIDNFVMVNFESFKAIIDAMGGITVDVQEYEANYINKRFSTNMTYGDNTLLSGRNALYFCRARGCDADGDVSRTRRQRQVVNAIMDKVKSASVSDLNKYLNILLPYVDTGYSKSEILSLGVKAITGGWAGFEREQLQMPDSDNRDSGSAGTAWIWVVDYQKAAQTLQKAIYGETNIDLPADRTSLIDIYHGASYDGGGSSSSDTPKTTAPVTNDSKVTTTEPSTADSAETTVPVSDTTAPVSESQPVSETQTETAAPLTTDAAVTTGVSQPTSANGGT